jgi:hypothetical protein
MNRLGWKLGRFRIPKPIDPMRVPDFMLRSIAFVVSIASDEGADEYDFEGSGFFIGLRSERCVGQSFFYFVTAEHVISRIKGRAGIRINSRQGGTTVVPVDRWYRHATDKYADVAVTPFINEYDKYDVAFIGEECFLKEIDEMRMRDVGIGDEVWFPGLFSLAQQESDRKNLPIVRMGNIAMLPRFRLPTELGPMEAYLVEARSIGGISGSPVFSRRTMSLIWNDEFKGTARTLHGMTGEIHLIGMMHGHWDIKESEINQPRIEPSRKGQGVNVGIAVVIPLHKIVDVIHLPELVAERKAAEDEHIREASSTAD